MGLSENIWRGGVPLKRGKELIGRPTLSGEKKQQSYGEINTYFVGKKWYGQRSPYFL